MRQIRRQILWKDQAFPTAPEQCSDKVYTKGPAAGWASVFLSVLRELKDYISGDERGRGKKIILKKSESHSHIYDLKSQLYMHKLLFLNKLSLHSACSYENELESASSCAAK